jgi:hypothetical protein
MGKQITTEEAPKAADQLAIMQDRDGDPLKMPWTAG